MFSRFLGTTQPRFMKSWNDLIMVMIDRISASLNRWVEYLLFVLGFAMAMIVATQVFSRYVLNHSLFWSEELARYLLVWLTFLGASTAYKRRLHPGVDVLVSRLPASLQKSISILVHAISLALFAVMVVYGLQFAYFIRSQITPALYLPKWTVFSIIPLSGSILIIHALAFISDGFKEHGRDR
jgi:TRAP-type C4-dicarboxylate transport system permease small subunit